MLGVDVGGTKVAAAPVDATGGLLADPLVEASRSEDVGSFLAGLEGTLRHALTEFADYAPRAIGLACAGTVDGGRGVVVASPNLPLIDVPLAGLLEKALGIPVTLENDANAAVLAEATAGVASGLGHVVMLTLGTGVGGGLFLDGRLYRGALGGAGEPGHMIVQAGGELCHCGAKGCLEMYASGPALVRYAVARASEPGLGPDRKLLDLHEAGGLSGRVVAQLAWEGRPAALAAVRDLAGWLGIGLVNLTNIFDPQMIVIGGGVSGLGELLLQPARELVRSTAMRPNQEHVRVERAALGEAAGLVGVGLAAWEVSGKSVGRPGSVG